MRGFDSLGGRAKQVLTLAVEEARAFKHGWLGAEYLLLGILRERSGAAHRVLEDRGIALELMPTARACPCISLRISARGAPA